MGLRIDMSTIESTVRAMAQRHPWVDLDDMRQEAAIALLTAIDKFDPDKPNANLHAYARQVVANSCRAYAWQCYGPTGIPDNSRRVLAAKSATSISLDCDSVPHAIAQQAQLRTCSGDDADQCTQERDAALARARSAVRFAILNFGEDADMIVAVLSGELSQRQAVKVYDVSARYVADVVQAAKSTLANEQACKCAYEDL